MGGGLCGANCLAVHLTFSEKDGAQVRKDINVHKLEYWQLYKDYYFFDDNFSEMIGSGSRKFKDEEEFKQSYQ